MNAEQKRDWMRNWAARNGCLVTFDGSCGFMRDCVGVMSPDGNTFPDYEWYSEDYITRLDHNGRVWTPEDAYHKHPCVAVLGHGEESEAQLYDWLRWFDDNGFAFEAGDQPLEKGITGGIRELYLAIGRDKYARMVKRS